MVKPQKADKHDDKKSKKSEPKKLPIEKEKESTKVYDILNLMVNYY